MLAYAGMVFYYVLLQQAVWWFFHVFLMFWKIRFPFHARSFETDGYFKRIHITCVILGLLIPLIPVITVLGSEGFTITIFPPLLCNSKTADPVFYALVLPIIVLLQVGVSLLVVIFWIVHKVCAILYTSEI